MPTRIALLRAVNVGGRGVIAMQQLRQAFVSAGCANVRTLLAAGNVIFEPPPGSEAVFLRKLDRALAATLGAAPDVILRTPRQLANVVAAAPFPDALQRDRAVKLYVTFLATAPPQGTRWPLVSDKEALEAVTAANRHVFVISRRKPNGMYGFPNNFIEAALGVRATTRNWSTILKIVKAAESG